jgi:hypothetical protein
MDDIIEIARNNPSPRPYSSRSRGSTLSIADSTISSFDVLPVTAKHTGYVASDQSQSSSVESFQSPIDVVVGWKKVPRKGREQTVENMENVEHIENKTALFDSGSQYSLISIKLVEDLLEKNYLNIYNQTKHGKILQNLYNPQGTAIGPVISRPLVTSYGTLKTRYRFMNPKIISRRPKDAHFHWKSITLHVIDMPDNMPDLLVSNPDVINSNESIPRGQGLYHRILRPPNTIFDRFSMQRSTLSQRTRNDEIMDMGDGSTEQRFTSRGEPAIRNSLHGLEGVERTKQNGIVAFTIRITVHRLTSI